MTECPQCHEPVDDTQNYCPACGYSLTDEN
jgi:predicted amidophosphoribosyltransferase